MLGSRSRLRIIPSSTLPASHSIPWDGLLSIWDLAICPSVSVLPDTTIPTAMTPTEMLMITMSVRPLLRHRSRQTFRNDMFIYDHSHCDGHSRFRTNLHPALPLRAGCGWQAPGRG